MRSDVPCAETARLVFAVGFPIALVCSSALSGMVQGWHRDGCDQLLLSLAGLQSNGSL